MPFGAHETMEVHEMLNEKINMINHFAFYVQQCQNPQLKQMIQRHLQIATEAYDKLVSYTHDYQAAARPVPGHQSIGIDPQQIQYGLSQPAATGPAMQGSWNDQAIASAVLACHKNSAKNHLTAALECADPNVRHMLMESSETCANQAYEVFLWMNGQGQYQIPTMHDHTAKTFLHRYQPVQQGIHQMSGAMLQGQPMSSGMGQMQPMSAGMSRAQPMQSGVATSASANSDGYASRM